MVNRYRPMRFSYKYKNAGPWPVSRCAREPRGQGGAVNGKTVHKVSRMLFGEVFFHRGHYCAIS